MMTFSTIYFNVIGIVGSTGEWCVVDDREEGEGDGGDSCFYLFLCIRSILVISLEQIICPPQVTDATWLSYLTTRWAATQTN